MEEVRDLGLSYICRGGDGTQYLRNRRFLKHRYREWNPVRQGRHRGGNNVAHRDWADWPKRGVGRPRKSDVNNANINVNNANLDVNNAPRNYDVNNAKLDVNYAPRDIRHATHDAVLPFPRRSPRLKTGGQ